VGSFLKYTVTIITVLQKLIFIISAIFIVVMFARYAVPSRK